MPSKQGREQALMWLKSKATNKNTLDAINAELCINVIMDLQRQYDRLAAQFGSLKKTKQDDIPSIKEEQLSFFDNTMK